MADTVDVNAVNDIVRRAVQGINVNKQRQTLEIQGAATRQPLITLTDHDVQYFATFLQENPRAVEKLVIERCSLTRQAVEILRWHFTSRAMSLRHIHFKRVNLVGNANAAWRRLLSGLNGSTCVTRLDLNIVGLEGHAGGAVISEVLQHNPSLIVLSCFNLRLGVEGARVMQPGLRANQTVQFLGLTNCDLVDEGTALIVNALQDTTSKVRGISFVNNRITSNGLPHVTRLLQNNNQASLRTITVDHNPGLFDNQENTRIFSNALQNSQVTNVSMNFCRLQGHAMTELFQAVLIKTTPTDSFCVYDNDQLQGADLERQLEIVHQIQNVRELRINLDFMDEAVLSSFRRNTSIQRLSRYVGGTREEITSGPVFSILKRNRWLYKACKLLDSEHGRRTTIPLGLWSKAIERLTPRDDDHTGASARYKITQEKIVMWWAPHHQAAAAASMTNNTPIASTTAAAAPLVATVAAAAAAAPPSSSTTTTETDAGATKDNDTMEDGMAVVSPVTNSTTTKCTDKMRDLAS